MKDHRLLFIIAIVFSLGGGGVTTLYSNDFDVFDADTSTSAPELSDDDPEGKGPDPEGQIEDFENNLQSSPEGDSSPWNGNEEGDTDLESGIDSEETLPPLPEERNGSLPIERGHPLRDLAQESTIDENEANDSDYYQPVEIEEFQIEDFADIKRKEVEHRQYRLRIGDRLLISIYGEPGTQRTIEVDPTGSIYYLYIDSMYVLGHTIDQVRRELEDQLKKHFKYGLISLTPIEFSGDFFSIMGEVRAPGLKLLKPRDTVLSALCEAGGFNTRVLRNETVDHVDLKHAFLARDGNYVPVKFEELVYDGDLSQDVPLKANDYLFIPASDPHQVFVLGQVRQRIVFDYFRTITLMEAIAEAGGVNDIASSRAIVIRGSLACPIRYLIDINRIFKGCAPDFMLCPGDIVYVPARQFTNIREMFNAALYSFITTAASSAGSRAYVSIDPQARITGVVEPVPVITPFSQPTTTVVQPVVVQ